MQGNRSELADQAKQIPPSLAIVLAALLICLTSGGCKRGFYRRTADRDAYHIISQNGAGPNWQIQPGFTIEPDVQSRFYDPTCPTDPTLPFPAPQLYNYQLPQLVTPAPEPRNLLASDSQDLGTAASSGELPTAPDADSPITSPGSPMGPTELHGVPHLEPSTTPSAAPETSLDHPAESSRKTSRLGRTRTASTPAPSSESLVIPASAFNSAGVVTAAVSVPTEEMQPDAQPEELPVPAEEFGQEGAIRIQPIPADVWLSLPEACLRRMLEFEAVRVEYERTFGRPVTLDQLDPSQRISLENILEILLINSREYQTRKETLYRVALRLSLQRFDYQRKFLARGNGTAVNYAHRRVAGIEANRLSIPTGIGITRSLYTAGDLVARFANDVVLTFNGPTGYTSSIGSELLVDLSQPLIQRDVQFEPLTQAERDVLYAARDFVQFRKQQFRDLAVQYYNLLLTYRSIAINTQDYFSNLGGFNRSVAYEQLGRIPRFQVDQFEQNALRSRGNLINSCNSLERSLDRLKLRIGLPPELPVNLDLTELEELTLQDEATVIREQIRRKADYVIQQLDRSGPQVAIPAAAELARRMLNLSLINEQLDLAAQGQALELGILIARLEAEAKRIEAQENALVLKLDDNQETEMLPLQVYLRTTDVVETTLESVQSELLLLQLMVEASSGNLETTEPEEAAADNQLVEDLRRRWRALVETFQGLGGRLSNMPNGQKAAELPSLIRQAEDLLMATRHLERSVLAELEDRGVQLATSELDLTQLAELVVEQSRSGDFATTNGLSSIEVDMDEAMLTALVQRLDLMNQRGVLADAWRQIKYAGDDLRSILNLRATQSIRTRTGADNPLDFTFDDSTTQLALNLDTPLNRRVERNNFRLALINYNVALRNLIDAQDNVKLEVRDDLRAIELDRNQYDIAIASAALAYERVASTRLQLATGSNVSARDFLEAQQAYTQSLSAVAQRHIGYIIDRIEFFLDIEQLQVDQVNFWPDLRNQEYPFLPNLDFSTTTPDSYGRLPYGPWYSKCIRRMEQVPTGRSAIHAPVKHEESP